MGKLDGLEFTKQEQLLNVMIISAKSDNGNGETQCSSSTRSARKSDSDDDIPVTKKAKSAVPSKHFQGVVTYYGDSKLPLVKPFVMEVHVSTEYSELWVKLAVPGHLFATQNRVYCIRSADITMQFLQMDGIVGLKQTAYLTSNVVNADGSDVMRHSECVYGSSKARKNCLWKAIVDNVDQSFYNVKFKVSVSLAELPQEGRFVSLLNVMKGIREAGLHTDVVLKVGGDLATEIKAHMAVLAGHSDVFAVMFATDMKESKERVVEIPDVDAETASAMLDFIYFRDLEKALGNAALAIELFLAADKYNMQELKRSCETIILGFSASQFSISSALKTYLCGHLNEFRVLQHHAVKILKEKSEDLRKSKEFKDFLVAHVEAAANLFGMLSATSDLPSKARKANNDTIDID